MPIPVESFKIVTPTHVLMHIKDWPLVDPTKVDPTVADALVLGEWLTPLRTEGKLDREDAAGGLRAWPLYAQKGQYDVQYQKIVPVIQHGTFTADTWLFDRATVNTLGQKLTAKLIAIDAINRSILTPSAGAEEVLAFVLKLPGSSSSPLRIFGNY